MKKLLKKTRLYRYLRKTNDAANIIKDLQNENLNLKRRIDEYHFVIDSKIEELRSLIIQNNRISNENLFATKFHDSSKNSQWLNIPLSLSSGAIGYPYAYILFRILDEIKPEKILEMGMGQSTKIINEYVKRNKNINYDIVEHDQNWIEFFKTNTNMAEISNIHLLENYKRKYNGTELNAYINFDKEFKGYKFDLISIDGPVGVGQEYSRMDIIDLIPECLENRFIILLDDCERIGEMRTIEILEEKLKKSNIKFYSGYQYWGTTSTYICVSEDLEFLCHI